MPNAKAGEPPAVTTANVDRVTSWTSSKLVFLDTRLSDAVEEANRYTETPVRVDDPVLSDLRAARAYDVLWVEA